MKNIYEVEYHRWYAKGIIKLARQDWTGALQCLDTAARRLSELLYDSKGIEKDYVKSWLFDLVGEIKRIEALVESEKPKKKLTEMLTHSNEQKKKAKTVNESNIPNTTFDDIAGLKNVKESVMYKVIYPRKHPELYNTFKKRTGGGILLYGLPGTGKTLIAEAIAHETGASFFSVKCSDLGSKWFGETEQNIRDIFESARACDNAVIFFDEIEAYATNRRDDGAMERSVSEFLTQMQGIGTSEDKNRILVIGATNKPWKLDGAFLRPGRFDEKIYVPLPDKKARRKIIDLRLKDVPKENTIDCSYLSEITVGFNGADVDYLCEKAKEFALRRVIQGKDTNEILTKADFDNAVASVKSSVLDSDKKEMELWIKNSRS